MFKASLCSSGCYPKGQYLLHEADPLDPDTKPDVEDGMTMDTDDDEAEFAKLLGSQSLRWSKRFLINFGRRGRNHD